VIVDFLASSWPLILICVAALAVSYALGRVRPIYNWRRMNRQIDIGPAVRGELRRRDRWAR